MQHHVSASKTALLAGLDFSTPPSSQYITVRRQAYSYPTGASSFSSNGNRVVRFQITSDSEWLDPSTLAFQCKLHNTNPAGVYVNHPDPSQWWVRWRCWAGGTLVEDIQHYNRVSEMFRVLQPSEHSVMQGTMGAGVRNSFRHDPVEKLLALA